MVGFLAPSLYFDYKSNRIKQYFKEGIRVAFFFNRTYWRILRPGMAYIMPDIPEKNSTLQQRFHFLDAAIEQLIDRARLAA